MTTVTACAVLAANRSIDLTLLDLSMRGVTGFDGLITIRASFPRIPILIVSGHEDPRIELDRPNRERMWPKIGEVQIVRQLQKPKEVLE